MRCFAHIDKMVAWPWDKSSLYSEVFTSINAFVVKKETRLLTLFYLTEFCCCNLYIKFTRWCCRKLTFRRNKLTLHFALQWLKDPGPRSEKRTLLCDMACFLLITPLAAISGWLCLRGAQDHLQLKSRLEAVGLIALTIALFTIYILWTLVTDASLVFFSCNEAKHVYEVFLLMCWHRMSFLSLASSHPQAFCFSWCPT